jgi:hypothetical protein
VRLSQAAPRTRLSPALERSTSTPNTFGLCALLREDGRALHSSLAAGRRAVARFWDLLLAATASRPTPPPDWAGVGTSHPILSIFWATSSAAPRPPNHAPALVCHSRFS